MTITRRRTAFVIGSMALRGWNTHAHPQGDRRSAFEFERALLPNPADYFQKQGLKPKGAGEWKTALCPLHKDTRPSLRVNLKTGAFKCWGCGAHGCDVLSFHMQRTGLKFLDAAIDIKAGTLRRNK
jgi:hypothetical protein